MLIMGINSYFEHPSVALIEDGEVLFAAEDERFTGIKHGRRYTPFSSYLPVNAMHKGLAYIGRTAADLDEIAYSYHRWDHLKSLAGCLTGSRLSSLRDELSAFATLANLPHALRSGYEIPHRLRDRLRPEDLRGVPVREWRHHLSHAASAYYCSGWDNALVVVADGAGEKACTTVYEGRGKELRKITEEVLPNSLGHFYSFVTEHLGFEPFGDEFKVMGLAAYGEPRYKDVFDSIVRLGPQGRYTVDLRALRSLTAALGERRLPHQKIEQIHMDIARSAQARLEETLVHLVSHHARATGLRRLCLAGGTFLNCVANGRLAGLGLFDEIFVQPAASDAGTALGAAALSAIRRGGDAQLRYASFALGTSHDERSIAEAIDQSGAESEVLVEKDMVERLARRLADGDICAVFRGRMEFGPRALGMRSLLASPLDPTMRKRLNVVKGREQFRPVAPLVADEAFDRYFDGHRDPYMLFTTKVRPEARDLIPSAVHADDTARVQSVPRDHDPFLHAVLTEFGRITGHPVLINTSFNVRGRPIIESPQEALGCFFSSGIEAMVMENRFIERRSR
ncbi:MULTISPECIES: carbamoyltransferase family protein [unclassified Streptomyces]|uniref:carbamoyltransferase family protein n=1 Tax=unclassified Streptomyces TaxID=2593676 RepID=UPI000DADC88F|nr:MULTISPECIES: carbamoyltransferase C-terminal domain-containing protein [unclassified Streptomyces]PZT72150.1 hypothetical protein DNK55_26600 [Streptomyces sp. AC1-42T]PZT81529.1 hypothetical protein DNK56_04975 [Streptomyces sp. AC1-42W]